MTYSVKPDYKEYIDLDGFEVKVPSTKDAWNIRVNFVYSDHSDRTEFHARSVSWRTTNFGFNETEEHVIHDVDIVATDLLHACLRVRDLIVDTCLHPCL